MTSQTLYFKLSRENSFGIGIGISTGPHARDYDSKTMIPYEISSLQIGSGIMSLRIKNISAIGEYLRVRYSINAWRLFQFIFFYYGANFKLSIRYWNHFFLQYFFGNILSNFFFLLYLFFLNNYSKHFRIQIDIF